MRKNKLSHSLKIINKKLHTPTWLFLLMFVVLILRIPSFFEPYSYGDEMIYLSLGEAVRQGVPLYKSIHDNKPPLLYIMAALSGSLFWFKAILAIWNLLTIFVFWKLSQRLFPKKIKLQKIATVLLGLLTTLPFLEGNIANAELFMIGPTILAFYLLLGKKKNAKMIFAAGLLFSVSTLFKVPAAFDIATIPFYWLAVKRINRKNLALTLKNTLVLSLGFLIPIMATFFWYQARGTLREYFIAAFGQNVGYLSSFRPGDTQKPFIEKNLPLIIRAGIVALGAGLLFLKRKRLSKQFVFLSFWLLLTIFAVTLSERPYPHYLIQSTPPASLLLAMLFTLNSIEQTLVIIPLSILFFAPVYFKFWYYPTTPYYTRFVKFATKKISKDEYLSSFGSHIPRNYEIASYLSGATNKSDKVFVWGDSSIIYALSRRLPPIKYVADYHIRDFSSSEEVVEGLEKNLPLFVVILPDSPPFPGLTSFLQNNYGEAKRIQGAVIWKLLNPRIRVLISS